MQVEHQLEQSSTQEWGNGGLDGKRTEQDAAELIGLQEGDVTAMIKGRQAALAENRQSRGRTETLREDNPGREKLRGLTMGLPADTTPEDWIGGILPELRLLGRG